MSTKTANRRPNGQGIKDLGQVVLVLQGGGALGAYQVGVYQALHEAGIEPDWVVGTSIGAINASIIAGNPPEERLPRLREFWRRMDRGPLTEFVHATPVVGPTLANWLTIGQGIQSFFTPNPFAFASVHLPLGGESAGFYSTAPLEGTLSDLVDFSRLADNKPRLTVGAANVRTGEMRYFDSRDEAITVKLDLDTGFGKVVVGQQLTPTDAVVSITRDGSGRRDQAALASRMLGGRAMRAALNSGPMRPVVGVRRVMCRPSLVIATSWSRSRSRSTSPHSGRKPALQQRSSSSLRRMSARKEQNTWPRMAASEEW